MRVGFVVGQFPMLSETFVISQMAGLLAEGVDVSVICNGISDYSFPDRQAPPLSTLLSDTRDWWGPAAGLKPQIDRLPAKLRDKVSTVLDRASCARLNACDVIVAHFGHNGSRAARLKKWNKIKPPIVTIFHGYDVGVPLHEGGLDRYNDLFRYGTVNLTVNDFFRRVLVDAGAPKEKVKLHRMGIDVTQIPFERRARSEEPLQFVSICRLTEKKGVEYALRALAVVHASNPALAWHYTVIGDGPLRSSLAELALALDIAGRVTFLGSVAHKDVKLRLKQSDVFILPSVTAGNGDIEGVPVALMEGMAAGLTVVSTYHSGIPELIEDQETGFLAPERDSETLAAKLAWIIEHPDECAHMAIAARQKVEMEFNMERLKLEFTQIVTDVAKSGATI